MNSLDSLQTEVVSETSKASGKTVAIVGTAGRQDAGARLTAMHFEWMCDTAARRLDELGLGPSQLRLVSGGAAWSDHVAVRLYLSGRAERLTLYLPCPWTGSQYLDTGHSSWISNPGRTANLYHRRFSQAWGAAASSLGEIAEAIRRGAEVVVKKGFHDRNREVARCDLLIAFTFGEGDQPADGGTRHTWDLAKRAARVHCCLPQFSEARENRSSSGDPRVS